MQPERTPSVVHLEVAEYPLVHTEAPQSLEEEKAFTVDLIWVVHTHSYPMDVDGAVCSLYPPKVQHHLLRLADIEMKIGVHTPWCQGF